MPRGFSRSMIVGRGRSYIVGDAAHADDDVEELARFGNDGGGGGHGGGSNIHQRSYSQAYSDRSRQPRVIEEEPTHPRQFPIGFASPQGQPVPGGGQQLIETKPQVLFRGERLAVPNSIVLNFQIVDVKVGKDSQLAAPGNMPSEVFSNISIGVRMELDTAEPGITITIIVQNVDLNNEHNFGSVLYGTVVE
jgi:hypothetical protein